ncbi:MAG TPA: nucleotidyltransferase family protein [Acetobacteraceae bacterium]|nr:nucleotidyltransferase family protein [Acetobacteraceae bacterium]
MLHRHGRGARDFAPLDAAAPELRLLLACSPRGAAPGRAAVLRGLLSDGIDWTRFAEIAVAHRLTNNAAATLADLVPDLLPPDLGDAFRLIVEAAERRGVALFGELVRLAEAFAADGIEAVPVRGPLLAIEAYGGLARRELGKLELLIREPDVTAAARILSRLGYARDDAGAGGLFRDASGNRAVLHTALAPPGLAGPLALPALWARVRTDEVNGVPFRRLAPEDELLLLALHGAARLWSRLSWAWDLAGFVGGRSDLDWSVAAERARAEGCARVLLLAATLACAYLGAPVPEHVVRAARARRFIHAMLGRILAQWEANPPRAIAAGWADRLLLQDGLRRRALTLSRMVLPARHRRAAPRRYHPALGSLPYRVAGSDVLLALVPASPAVKRDARRYERARREALDVLSREPDNAAALRDLGDALSGLRRHREALASYDRALALVPQDTITWKRRAAAQLAAGGPVTDPTPPPTAEDAGAWAIRAMRLFGARRFAEAIEASDRALALDPDNIDAQRAGIHARLCACDWRRRREDEQRVDEGIAAGRLIVGPFWHRAISDSESDALRLARLFSSGLLRPRPPVWRGERYGHAKIRVGYCSMDFRDHVVADVLAGCLEHHDRSRFEITALSFGPDDRSAARRRIAATCDRFIDIRGMSDEAAARLIREMELDIVIDLNGNTGDRRTGIFAFRPAPVQATFLGYPGTMGLPFYDYIIADEVVIPPPQRAHYSEQVIYLPHSFMPTDGARQIPSRQPTRAQAGLPETGFVFACHNHDYKLGPEMFDIWMRLLRSIAGSVLWLRALNPAAMLNLRREASARGVAPERIVFAPRVPTTEDHLARLQLADLFLDTRPYNAHATACDALWVGLPVITCPGESFPSRVAASVLRAVEMPELITSSLVEYEALAAALARDPARLTQLREKLVRKRASAALFDTARYTRDLESAYAAMRERQRAGLPPASFAVGRLASCAA